MEEIILEEKIDLENDICISNFNVGDFRYYQGKKYVLSSILSAEFNGFLVVLKLRFLDITD
ncbi:hypothetical protein [Bacillus cereus]|uniref:hypothetical protein n=1 Tax=Bacillus cereus TaxID=1396 RepID=UPI0009954B45|nr:hypothetical protein [Bacillus cereus]